MTDFANQERTFLQQVLNQRMLICLCTGFASGLPLYILFQLIPAWLRLEDVSLTAIGFFNAIQLPYVLKFLWAPLLERYSLPFLGRRRGWMLVIQVSLIFAIAALGWWKPSTELQAIVLVSIFIAIASATQDVVLDAYRREILETEGELALGNNLHVQAYRISSLIPGSLGLFLIGVVDWHTNFVVMAAFMLVGVGR